MSFRKSLLAAATISILGAAGTVQAQTCVADRDCPQGFACQSTTVAVPEPGCRPGADCPKPDASPPMVIMTCAPRSCGTDADCGTGMVCYAQTSTACSGGTAVAPPAVCPEDRPCADAGAPSTPPKPPEEMCTTTTTRTCAFKWQLPCNMDSDCGAGFSCKPTVSGACSGSGSTGPGTTGGGSSGSAGSGGATRPAPFAPPTDAGMTSPPMCTTMTSYPGYCQPTATSCKTDADCPSPWKCADSPETPVSGGPTPAPAGGGAAIAPPIAPDAGAPAMRVCVNGYDTPARAGKDEGAMGTTGPTTGNGGSGSPITPSLPPSGSGADAGAGPATKGGSGCAMGGAGASGAGLALVMVLGLLVARRRRR